VHITAFLIVGLFAGHALIGCAQIATQQSSKDFQACAAEVKATPEARLVFTRLWAFDDTDTSSKLSDKAPLTKEQRDALVVCHNRNEKCRQIIVNHDVRFAAWELPYWERLFQRGDAIVTKLAAGEIPVGVANQLLIQVNDEFKVAVSQGNAQAAAIAAERQQRASEAMMQAGSQMIAASQQHSMTTTNCSWLGNTLNCTSVH
jgi:hypothetical protein